MFKQYKRVQYNIKTESKSCTQLFAESYPVTTNIFPFFIYSFLFSATYGNGAMVSDYFWCVWFLFDSGLGVTWHIMKFMRSRSFAPKNTQRCVLISRPVLHSHVTEYGSGQIQGQVKYSETRGGCFMGI